MQNSIFKKLFLIVTLISLSACGGGGGGNSSVHPNPFNDFSLSFAGSGSGSVNISPIGVDCSSPCVNTFANNSDVVLSATPIDGNNFAGWSGDEDCADGEVILNVAVKCIATFNIDPVAPTFNLSVVTIDLGKVISVPAGIDCDVTSGPVCTKKYTENSNIELSAIPKKGYRFVGWTGDTICSSNVTVAVSSFKMPALDITCRANFEAIPIPYALNITVVGSGNVTSTEPVPVFNCGGLNKDCSQSYAAGTQVVLTAKADALNRFVKWSGDTACTQVLDTTTLITTVTLPTVDVNCTAQFELIPKPVNLTITFAGTGGGGVTLTPIGNPSVLCKSPNTCINGYDGSLLQKVTMKATKNAGSGPVVWSGVNTTDCNDGIVTISTSLKCIATFDKVIVPKFEVTVLKSGTGLGSVSTSPVGSACATPAPSCSSFPVGTSVTLVANPTSPGNTFDGWGIDTRSHADCANGNVNQSLQGSITCYATFTPTVTTKKLTVTLTGNGKVNLNTTPPLTVGGTDCITNNTPECDGNFSAGTSVVLMALPNPANHFVSWSGGIGCNSLTTPTITFSMPTAALSCTATFAADPVVTILLAGTGSGSVTAVPKGTTTGGINCLPTSTQCSSSFKLGSTITFTATPDVTTSTFTGWTGVGCPANSPVDVKLTKSLDCTATFKSILPTTFKLTVSVNGPTATDSGGVVTSTAPTPVINCGSPNNTACVQNYPNTTSIVLTATPTAGNYFVSWSLGCSGTGANSSTGESTVTIADADATCTATFAAKPVLTITFTGVALTITDTVNSAPVGISCNGTTAVCSGSFLPGTQVTLTAATTPAGTFNRWTGIGCTPVPPANPADPKTIVPMDATKTCTAKFN